MTKISWTDETWNPIAGCSVVSAGCKNCYAMQFAGTRLKHLPKYAGLTEERNGRIVWTGDVRLDEKALEIPYKWRKPRRVFVNSMSDLFHEDVPERAVHAVFQAADDNPQHTFQILTKRPEIMARYVNGYGFDVPPNMWLGVSVEDQRTAAERIPYLGVLLESNIGFVSYEPALGTIDWHSEWSGFIDQIIVGAESGPNRRPFDMQWARDTRDYCLEHGIAFFFKQGSARKSGVAPYLVNADGTCWQWHQYPGDLALPVEVAA